MSVQTRDIVLGLLGKMALSGGAQGTVGRIGLSSAMLAGVHPQSPKGGVISDSAKTLEGLRELPDALKELMAVIKDNTDAIRGGAGTGGKGGASDPFDAIFGHGNMPKDMASRLKNFQGDPSAGDAAAGAGEAGEAAEVGGAEAGAGAAGPIGAIAIIAIELAKIPSELQAFGDGLIESQRSVAKFSGQMAGAYAQLDIGRLQRDIQQAQAIGGSAAYQAQAQNHLEDAMQPWRELFAELKNDIVGALEEGTAGILDAINSLIPGFMQKKKRELPETTADLLQKRGFGGDKFHWNPPIYDRDRPRPALHPPAGTRIP